VSILRNPAKTYLGRDVVLKKFVEICVCNPQAAIKIGNRTTIGNFTHIYASEKIVIGNDCMIAPFVYIVDSDHGTNLGSLMNQQENITAPIIIGDDVWIGSHSIILKGIKIGNGVIIAANSVVNKDLEEFSIYGGSPVKLLKKRI